jgi:transposase-like protein
VPPAVSGMIASSSWAFLALTKCSMPRVAHDRYRHTSKYSVNKQGWRTHDLHLELLVALQVSLDSSLPHR